MLATFNAVLVDRLMGANVRGPAEKMLSSSVTNGPQDVEWHDARLTSSSDELQDS